MTEVRELFDTLVSMVVEDEGLFLLTFETRARACVYVDGFGQHSSNTVFHWDAAIAEATSGILDIVSHVHVEVDGSFTVEAEDPYGPTMTVSVSEGGEVLSVSDVVIQEPHEDEYEDGLQMVAAAA